MPRVFTKLLKPIFATLAEAGHECFPYIDDSFVVANSASDCREALEKLCRAFDELGFCVHVDKSTLQPTQEIFLLGFWLDSRVMTVALTREKKFTRAARDLLAKGLSRIREVAGLIGLMVAYSPAVEYGPAHIKLLEIDKNEALVRSKGSFDQEMTLSPPARGEIDWWLQHLEKKRAVRLGVVGWRRRNLSISLSISWN